MPNIFVYENVSPILLPTEQQRKKNPNLNYEKNLIDYKYSTQNYYLNSSEWSSGFLSFWWSTILIWMSYTTSNRKCYWIEKYSKEKNIFTNKLLVIRVLGNCFIYCFRAYKQIFLFDISILFCLFIFFRFKFCCQLHQKTILYNWLAFYLLVPYFDCFRRNKQFLFIFL